MMSMHELALALAAAGLTVYEWSWTQPDGADTWVIVSADGAKHDHAGDDVDDQAFSGTVDVFTRVSVPSVVDTVQGVLSASGMPWEMSDILYDNPSRAVHLVWNWKTVGGL
jgi:hypothetical protein